MSVGRLVVCPTPIGNLADVTERTLEVLRTADVVACEDTRHTGGLLTRHGIAAAGRLVSCHEHNEHGRAEELVGRIAAGGTVALASDAGMPGVSDPGRAVVLACVAAGVRVEVLPGASAVPVALVASGLPAESWRFVGFLPRKRGALEALLAETTETTVAFESPRRVAASLRVLAALDPERPVAVCRELSKLHEEIVRGPAVELAEAFATRAARGEVVLVVGAAPAGAARDAEARAAVARLVEGGARRRVAASVVAGLTGGSANALYRAGDGDEV